MDGRRVMRRRPGDPTPRRVRRACGREQCYVAEQFRPGAMTHAAKATYRPQTLRLAARFRCRLRVSITPVRALADREREAALSAGNGQRDASPTRPSRPGAPPGGTAARASVLGRVDPGRASGRPRLPARHGLRVRCGMPARRTALARQRPAAQEGGDGVRRGDATATSRGGDRGRQRKDDGGGGDRRRRGSEGGGPGRCRQSK